MTRSASARMARRREMDLPVLACLDLAHEPGEVADHLGVGLRLRFDHGGGQLEHMLCWVAAMQGDDIVG